MEKIYQCEVVKPGSYSYRDYLAFRYRVFCEELKRLSGMVSGGKAIESDHYDAHSLHVLCRRARDGMIVGCLRMILPNCVHGLNITSRYVIQHNLAISAVSTGEIGRFALASELRRYRGERDEAQLSANCAYNGFDKRDAAMVEMELCRTVFRLADEHGVQHSYAAMEPTFARLLIRAGFPFRQAGPLNTNFQPARQPYLIGIQDVRSVMSFEQSAPPKKAACVDGVVMPPAWMVNAMLERSGKYPVYQP